MSGAVMGLVLKVKLGSPTKKAVLLAMADKADDAGEGIFKSATTIATEAECSRETVIRVWKEFSKGPRPLISKTGKLPVRGGHVIVWKINIEALHERAGSGDNRSPLEPESGDVKSHLQEKSGDDRSPGSAEAVISRRESGDVRSHNTPLIQKKYAQAGAPEMGGAPSDAKSRLLDACRQSHGRECAMILASADGWDDRAIYLSSPFLLSYAEPMRRVLREAGVELKASSNAPAKVVSINTAKARG